MYPSDDSPQATALDSYTAARREVYPSDDSPQATAKVTAPAPALIVYPSDDSPHGCHWPAWHPCCHVLTRTVRVPLGSLLPVALTLRFQTVKIRTTHVFDGPA